MLTHLFSFIGFPNQKLLLSDPQLDPTGSSFYSQHENTIHTSRIGCFGPSTSQHNPVYPSIPSLHPNVMMAGLNAKSSFKSKLQGDEGESFMSIHPIYQYQSQHRIQQDVLPIVYPASVNFEKDVTDGSSMKNGRALHFSQQISTTAEIPSLSTTKPEDITAAFKWNTTGRHAQHVEFPDSTRMPPLPHEWAEALKHCQMVPERAEQRFQALLNTLYTVCYQSSQQQLQPVPPPPPILQHQDLHYRTAARPTLTEPLFLDSRETDFNICQRPASLPFNSNSQLPEKRTSSLPPFGSHRPVHRAFSLNFHEPVNTCPAISTLNHVTVSSTLQAPSTEVTSSSVGTSTSISVIHPYQEAPYDSKKEHDTENKPCQSPGHRKTHRRVPRPRMCDLEPVKREQVRKVAREAARRRRYVFAMWFM